MDDEFASWIPSKIVYINMLINKNVIDHYLASKKSQRVLDTLRAKSKTIVERFKEIPTDKYGFTRSIELFGLGGQRC